MTRFLLSIPLAGRIVPLGATQLRILEDEYVANYRPGLGEITLIIRSNIDIHSVMRAAM
jgi:hypothetical protein